MSKAGDSPQGWTFERAAAERGPLLHPLAGANLRTFLRQYFGHRGYSGRSFLQRLIAWGAQVGKWPFSAFESFHWKKAIREHTIDEPPIFLIGHWRSGTTHLHNLLSRDPQFGFLDVGQATMPWNMLGEKAEIGRSIVNSVLPETRGYDNVKLAMDEPQEEEWALANMNPISFFNIYYFPGRFREHARRALFFEEVGEPEKAEFVRCYEFLVRKLSYARKGQRLLLKNPSSTVRIPLLKQLFPGARFVHIVRNPYPVYRSSIGKFPRLFNVFAWQDFLDIDVHRFTIETYVDLMRRYLEDRECLGEEELFETTYEKITSDPLGEIEKIYDAFEIGGKEKGLQSIREYTKNIRDYQPNVHTISREHAEEIRKEWAFSFERWGYPLDPPEGIAIED